MTLCPAAPSANPLPSLGPVIGGALSYRFGWRSTFAAMAILGGVMFLLMLVFLEVGRAGRGRGVGPRSRWGAPWS
jgi:predicted MFS family arabinose efflux permease